MTDDRDDEPEEQVGYRRPPKSGQFRKGQSGNPRGRPAKPKTRLQLEPARYPTSEILRAEAARVIAINDAKGRQELTVSEAVVRALGLAAMRGGVLAQRTYLEHAKAEDERSHREHKERYEFWKTYQEEGRRSIAAALKAGLPEPDWLPHPDDIQLNPWSLTVRFLGALDEEGREAEKQADAFQRLGYEMAIYTGEDNRLPPGKGKDGQFGFYMALHLVGRKHLPPRLRLSYEALDAEIKPRISLGVPAWGDDLERRCQEGKVLFVRARAGLRMPTRSLSSIGVRWTPAMAEFTETGPPKRRRRRKNE